MKLPYRKTLLVVAAGIASLALTVEEVREHLKKVTLNFPLYQNEVPQGGSLDAEKDAFIMAGLKVIRAQDLLATVDDKGVRRRVFHAKQHACLTAKFHILEKRYPKGAYDGNIRETYKGLFDINAPNFQASYDAIIRFSNGVGSIEHDALPDVRGLAIKLVDVKMPAELGSLEEKTGSVDFLATNSPMPFGADLNEFLQFMEDVTYKAPGHDLPLVGHGLAMVTGPSKFIADRFGSWEYLFNRQNVDAAGKLLLPWQYPPKPVIKSLVKQGYWGGHPYLMGANSAMKFNLQIKTHRGIDREVVYEDGPDEEGFLNRVKDKARRSRKNYLREDLLTRTMGTQEDPITFVFNVQMERSKEATPIENQLDLWTESESISIPVAELVIDRQNFDKPEIDAACEQMRFTPGHYHTEHRPLGNMGRGRIFALEASQFGRAAQDPEPTTADVEALRKLNALPRD